MAPTMPLPINPRIPDHGIRLTTIILFLPAFVMLIPYGVASGSPAPTIGLVPMFLSAVLGIVHIAGYARYRPLNIIMDVFLACFLIGVLIPGWLIMAAEGWNTRSGETMLGCYGSAPMMASFVIHTYLALRELYKAWKSGPGPKCPHCHASLPASARSNGAYAAVPAGDYDADVEEAAGKHSHDSKESFHSSHGRITLQEDQPEASSSKEPRPSTDDETARLV